MMDRRRTDAEGGGCGGGGGHGQVVHRHNRTSKLAIVVILQNMLVAACLIVTLYVYWEVYQEPVGNIHIEFLPITNILGNTTLKFTSPYSKNKMDLIEGDKIVINCTGPYVLYMHVCYKSLNNKEATGILQLQVEEDVTPVASVMMNTSQDDCRGLHSVAYLKARTQARLHLYSTESFKIKEVIVGLSCLLGPRCES